MINALPSFQWRKKPFAAWVFKIAHNTVVSHYRNLNSRSNEELVSSTRQGISQDSQETPEQAIERKEEFRRFTEMIKHLAPDQRNVIFLRFAAGLSINDTAKVIGKKPGNVKVLQHKGVARLRKMFAPQENQVA